MNERIVMLFKRLKNGKTLFIVGLVGILLIFASSLVPSGYEKETMTTSQFDSEAYRQELEKSVKKTVQSITGNRDVTVCITLDGGVRYTYADDSRTSSTDSDSETESESEKKYIIITDSSGNEKAVSVYEAYPEVRGVTVVYKGSSAYEEKIKSAVMAALGITSKRIFTVAKGGN